MSNSQILRELETTHEELINQVCHIYVQWNESQTLFVNDEVLELLNGTAPSFFSRFQRLIFDDIISSISRLADPPEDKKYKNLSMPRLQKCVHATQDQQLIADFDIAFIAFTTAVTSLVKYRNKRLAHTDLDTLRQVAKLPSVTISDIKKALVALSSTMNIVHEYLHQSFMGYEHTAPGRGSADFLVYCLRKGHQAIQEEQNKLLEEIQKYAPN